jgi:proteasome assembly chaperone (PAC2) family protein
MTLRLSVAQGIKLASGQITGAAGLIAGLSKYYGFRGGVLLAETNGQLPDNQASKLLYEKVVSLINKVVAS